MPNYTKDDIARHVADEVGITLATARAAVQAFLEGVAGMDDSGPLILKGFGTFRYRHRAPRVSGLTGEKVPAARQLVFKASRSLRGPSE